MVNTCDQFWTTLHDSWAEELGLIVGWCKCWDDPKNPYRRAEICWGISPLVCQHISFQHCSVPLTLRVRKQDGYCEMIWGLLQPATKTCESVCNFICQLFCGELVTFDDRMFGIRVAIQGCVPTWKPKAALGKNEAPYFCRTQNASAAAGIQLLSMD